ncbi:hypothetical protein AYK24_06240 [Thermoplasmatales archaeon SG8-52-4]|nr:MAG: hypothetical protein AYK24_06240 [Thermoplasmatales archaeon SG8-52-4]
MKTIGLFTNNFSLYHDLIKILKKRKVPYVSLSSVKNIPSSIGVIITSNNELHDIKSQKVIAADAYDTIDHAVDLALQMLIGKELYSKIFIGIDPGDSPGIAVVGDDILLQKINIDAPEKVVTVIKRILREYPALETLIRIGHGSILTRNRIINSLIPLKIPIEIVDETKTTPSQQIGRHQRDSEAAAVIALLTGGKVQKRLPLEPTKGDIRNIQERSRKLTGGKFSISEKTAKRVLEGSISLIEAIELEKNSKKK